MMTWLSQISPCVHLVGDQMFDGGWIEPLRVIYDHELVLFAGGAFEVDFDDRTISCPPDSFIIIPPGRRHVSRAASPGGGRRCWVHFDWTWRGPHTGEPVITYLPGRPMMSRYRPAPDFVPAGVLAGPIPTPRRTFDTYGEILHLWSLQSDRGRQTARARLLELLADLLTGADEPAEPELAGGVGPGRIRAVLDRIAALPLAETPSVQTALEQLGASYAHLCRRFRRAYGLPPLQYVNSLRIERAKLLLRDDSAPIAEVAARVGFDNPAYFCRLFRKHTGQSPTQYALACRPS